MNLSGYRFTSGIQFLFTKTNSVTALAPDERVLVVKNRAAFATRYPGVTGIAGEYEGMLSNGGNRLTLAGPLLEPVASLNYDATRFPLADGPGFSLVPVDEALPTAQPEDLTNWRLSARPNGSPGAVDPEPFSVAPIFVNELLPQISQAQDCKVEFFNPTAAPVNISGWFLTDNFNKPKKYRFPNGTFLQPNGFFVLSENTFASADGSTFSFNAEGEAIYLFSADAAGNFTGWMHGYKYDAAGHGTSFGRHVTRAGADAFVIQSNPTLGLANTGPRVGPIVLSEIHFEPLPVGGQNNTGDEFIELHNITAQSVPLFDSVSPSHPWRLRGRVDFDFASGAVIPADAYVALVSFDPALHPWAAAAFRARFGVDARTTLPRTMDRSSRQRRRRPATAAAGAVRTGGAAERWGVALRAGGRSGLLRRAALADSIGGHGTITHPSRRSCVWQRSLKLADRRAHAGRCRLGRGWIGRPLGAGEWIEARLRPTAWMDGRAIPMATA